MQAAYDKTRGELKQENAVLREQLAHRTIELERESREMQKWNNRANQLAVEGQGLRQQLAQVTQERNEFKRRLKDWANRVRQVANELSTAAPSLPSATRNCVTCGHSNTDREGVCKTQVSPPNYRSVTYCGCKCKFTRAAAPVAAPENEQNVHPEDFCDKCGQPNISWFAPNELWNKAVRAIGEPEILCPVCFVRLAEATGTRTTWEVAPRNWHAGETQKSVTRAFAVIDKAIESATTQSSDQVAREIAIRATQEIKELIGNANDQSPSAYIVWPFEKTVAIIIKHLRAAAVPVEEALVDEVQHRMDQVVEAAVEWHQSDEDWIETSEKLSAAIESLLELRSTPTEPQS